MVKSLGYLLSELHESSVSPCQTGQAILTAVLKNKDSNIDMYNKQLLNQYRRTELAAMEVGLDELIQTGRPADLSAHMEETLEKASGIIKVNFVIDVAKYLKGRKNDLRHITEFFGNSAYAAIEEEGPFPVRQVYADFLNGMCKKIAQNYHIILH